MRQAILFTVCALLSIPNAFFQHKRPRPKPKPDNFEKYLVPIPEDEILFTQEETKEIYHSGWRIAVRSVEEKDKSQDVAYYDRDRIERLPNNITRTWIRYTSVKAADNQSHAMNLEEYDCGSNRRTRTLTTTDYDKDYRVKGSTRTFADPEWDFVIPDTVGERLWLILCKDRVDEELIDFRLARDWFRDARQAEKKDDLQNAIFWYKAALEHAPDNLKLILALDRVNGLLPRKPNPAIPKAIKQ